MGSSIALGLTSVYFTTYYNAAANIVTAAFPLAVIVSAPLTQLLIDTYGWRGTMLLFSGLNLHYIAAAALLNPTNQIRTDYKGAFYKPLTRAPDAAANSCELKSGLISRCLDAVCNVTSLLKNGRFLIFLVINMMSGYNFNGWVVYLVSIAQSKGLSPSDAANVATLGGVGAIFITIILAIVQRNNSYRELILIGLVFGIISYGGMFFPTSFWLLSLCSFTLGISCGIVGAQVLIGANAVVPKDDAVGALAWLNLAFGLGYITSGYVSGKLSFIQVSFSCP